MKKFLEKNKKILAIIFIALAIIGSALLIILKNNKTKIKEVNETNYTLQYDNTWKIAKEEETEIELIHKKSNSVLNIKINQIDDEYQYKTLDEIADNLLYNIQKQNKNYKLICREKARITKNNLEAYKLLFESEDKQAVVYVYKQGVKIIAFTFEAMFDYFDILLDSVNSIIYSFNTNEQKFNVATNIELNTTNINYTEQEDIKKLLKDTSEHEIALSNYLVNYSIPSNFKSTKYDTRYGWYKFEDAPTGISYELKSSILQRNIYEYLDRTSSVNVYSNYNLNSYNKSNEELEKCENEYLKYIYKNSYLTNNKVTENIEVIFELNKNHICVLKISSMGAGIPKELVDMIKINKIENIASNVNVQKENGMVTSKLKRFTDYTYSKTEEITLKLPETYQEIDKETNLYEERNFVCNYNQEKEIYDYEVSYETTYSSTNLDSRIEVLNKEIEYFKKNGKYKEFSAGEDITANTKKFKVYNSEYIRSK